MSTTKRASRRSGCSVRCALALIAPVILAACGGSGSSDPVLADPVAIVDPADDDPDPTDNAGTEEPGQQQSDVLIRNTSLDGVRLIDDRDSDDPSATIARLYITRDIKRVRFAGIGDRRLQRLDVAFERDGSASVRFENSAGARTLEMDSGSYAIVWLTFAGSADTDVTVTGDVPRDTELFIQTSGGDDRFDLSGDIGDGASVTLASQQGSDLMRMTGDVLAGGLLEMEGGSGNDRITFEEGDVVVSAGSGDDTIAGSGRVRASSSSIDAGSGDDRISGLVGSIRGGSGDDVFVAVATGSVSDLAAGERALQLSVAIGASLADSASGGESDPEPEEPSTPAAPPEPVADAPRVSSPVPDLRAIWTVGRVDLLGAAGPTVVREAVLEFNDGSVTTDVDTVVASGRAASRRSNPTRWGTSRVSGDVLTYRLDGASRDVDNRFVARTRPARVNERLSGCYGSSSGFSSGGVASISVNLLCLDRQGRFSNDRTVATSNPAGSGSSNSQVTGTYRMDGYGIRLDYDDGKTLTTTLGIYEEGGQVMNLLVGRRVLEP